MFSMPRDPCTRLGTTFLLLPPMRSSFIFFFFFLFLLPLSFLSFLGSRTQASFTTITRRRSLSVFPPPSSFRIILSLLGSVIAVLSPLHISREARISISEREESEMKNSYASFALPFALSPCLLFMNADTGSLVPSFPSKPR